MNNFTLFFAHSKSVIVFFLTSPIFLEHILLSSTEQEQCAADRINLELMMVPPHCSNPNFMVTIQGKGLFTSSPPTILVSLSFVPALNLSFFKLLSGHLFPSNALQSFCILVINMSSSEYSPHMSLQVNSALDNEQ